MGLEQGKGVFGRFRLWFLLIFSIYLLVAVTGKLAWCFGLGVWSGGGASASTSTYIYQLNDRQP